MYQIKLKMKRFLFPFGMLVVLIGMNFSLNSCNSTSSTTLPGGWDKIGDFAGIPRDGAVSFVIDNIAYVGLGYNYASNSFLQDFYRYEPNSDSWYPVADFPGARSGAVAFTLNGKGYVGTGYNIVNGSTNPLSDFYQYDPAANTWTKIADFGFPIAKATVAARYGAAAFTVKNRAFVGWGEDINQFDYKDLWEYDAVNNVWNQVPDTGSKRVYPFVFVIDDIAYVGGGFDPAGGNSYPAVFNRFDVTKLSADGTTGNPWSRMNDLSGKDKNGNGITQPARRYQAATFSINHFGYLTMGSAGNGDTWQYTPPVLDANGNITSGDTWLQYFSITTNVPTYGANRVLPVGFTVTLTTKTGTKEVGILTTGGSGNSKFDDCWLFDPTIVEPDYK